MEAVPEGFSRIAQKIVIILRSKNCMHYRDKSGIYYTGI